MAVVFLIAGIALLFGSDEVCAKAEELLKKNGAPEQKISDVENHLQSSSTMLQNILLLVGGVAASSVILSLRMKDKLWVLRRVRPAVTAAIRSSCYVCALLVFTCGVAQCLGVRRRNKQKRSWSQVTRRNWTRRSKNARSGSRRWRSRLQRKRRKRASVEQTRRCKRSGIHVNVDTNYINRRLSSCRISLPMAPASVPVRVCSMRVRGMQPERVCRASPCSGTMRFQLIRKEKWGHFEIVGNPNRDSELDLHALLSRSCT